MSFSDTPSLDNFCCASKEPPAASSTNLLKDDNNLPALSALPAMRDLKALVKEPGEAQSEDGGLEVAIPEEACDNAQALEATNNVFTPDLLGKSADQLDGIVTQ